MTESPGAGTSVEGMTRVTPDWLALREPADAAARAHELLVPLRTHLAETLPGPGARVVVRDLGCGTGSMGRWLAGRLPGPQLWIMQDRDLDLLDIVAARSIGTASDGSPVSVVPEQGDVAHLRADELADTALVTTSALLDLLTADEVRGIAEACVTAGCPALLTLSVVGRVDLDPPDPLDQEITDAFNAHQRRVTGSRRLLGPDAVEVAAEAFERLGATVLVRSSPWRLDAGRADLVAEWLRGWVGAACEQRPDLAGEADAYLRRRLDACAAGELGVLVHHSDLLALPPSDVSR